MKNQLLVIAVLLTICSFSKLSELTTEVNEISGTSLSYDLQCPPPPSFNELVSLREGEETVADEFDGNWYSKALEHIRKDEYNITYSNEHGAYQSPNRVNNIRFIYHNDGFTAKARDVNETEDWSIRLKVLSDNLNIGHDDGVSGPKSSIAKGNSDNIQSSQLTVAGNEAWTENESMRIDYVNTEEGMRQDFIVKQKPSGKGNLRIDFTANTKLKMNVGADALIFSDNNGGVKMKYSALKVWDANGKPLRAYFEKNSELRIKNYESSKADRSFGGGILNSEFLIPNSFSIVVNDADAVYPVTIDPLSTSPAWSAESNQSNSSFGESVSTAGDVNGDGYSDVIIGATDYDNGQTNEGSVFVYHGSASGLSVVADWTSEPNQQRASFGSSVSTAGDVNGDGYSDVLIGVLNFDNGQINEGKISVYYGSASGLSAVEDWSYEGDQDNSWLGTSVSTAGDVNGDGFSDIIAGLPNYSGGETSEGRAVIFHGSASGLSTVPDWTMELDQSQANVGRSVSTAGDVNGDGFSDVIVGANNYDNSETDEGAAFVFHGSASGVSAVADWTAESNQTSANFGISVSTAGDVNGDGYSDVLVGAYAYDNTEIDEGAFFAYYGSASGLSATSNFSSEINQESAAYGYSVSTAGDVNGDGYSDVIAGAYGYDNGQINEGRAYVFYGSATGILPQQVGPFQWITESNQASANFGSSVATAGDVNGDGYSDVIVGAYGYDNGQSNEGSAFVYLGSSGGLNSSVNHISESDQPNANFGYAVSTAGDLNGDGYSDILIGAEAFDNGELNEGKVYVFNGSSSGPGVTADWTAESDIENARFGSSVSTAGDVNGDGYSDIIIGARLYSGDQAVEGKAYIFFGSATGLSTSPDWTAEGNQDNSFFGGSVSTAGDVNGDGYSDVIVGAKFFDNGQIAEGRVFVYYGSLSGPGANADWSVESNLAYTAFGVSVSSAGDVNGDGFSDVIIGAEGFTDGESAEGAAFVFHGSALGLSNSADWNAQSNQSYAFFGNSVSAAGDVNGDGFSDVIIGSWLFDNGLTDEGSAFVYHGSITGLSAAADWFVQGNQSGSGFGSSVSTAGDVNGDGFSEVIVGAPEFDGGTVNEGAAFVYHGSQTGLSAVPDWTAKSNQVDAVFGNAVSSAGDVNGDGYSDVIVGSLNYDNGESNEGRCYVYYGNLVNGLLSAVQQYRPASTDIVCSGGKTGIDGQVKMGIFGKSPFGRAKGRIVHDYVTIGVPFSNINSTQSTGSGVFADLGTSGSQLTDDESGLTPDNVYRWRARVQYDIAGNPYQKYGPWKYYAGYSPTPWGDFRAGDGNSGSKLQLDITLLIQGFYDAGTDAMVQDTVRVYLRSSSFPFSAIDSASAVLNGSGSGIFLFNNAVNGTPYFLQISHRNSIETWSATAQSFFGNSMTYDLTSSLSQAYGSNMIQVDASPVLFAIYGGDVNQDGTVDATDVSTIDNDASNFISGYVMTDLTGDDFVDGTDFAIADNNAANFVSVVRP